MRDHGLDENSMKSVFILAGVHRLTERGTCNADPILFGSYSVARKTTSLIRVPDGIRPWVVVSRLRAMPHRFRLRRG